jgi:hypothetical protein
VTAPPRESLMMLVAGYCERKGWIPVGQRIFRVGDWLVTVNGSAEVWNKLPPWHVLADNQVYLSMLLFSPAGGTVGGYQDGEPEFRAALAAEHETAVCT